jgi:hypothetical protein
MRLEDKERGHDRPLINKIDHRRLVAWMEKERTPRMSQMATMVFGHKANKKGKD